MEASVQVLSRCTLLRQQAATEPEALSVMGLIAHGPGLLVCRVLPAWGLFCGHLLRKLEEEVPAGRWGSQPARFSAGPPGGGRRQWDLFLLRSLMSLGRKS